MKISECMTHRVRLVVPDAKIRDAARIMAELDAGALPVGDKDRLVGMLTDRDIAVRAIAAGKGPDTPVAEIMSREVRFCYDDDDVDQVAQNMANIQVRRLPVVNRSQQLVGIVTLGDMAAHAQPQVIGEALSGISRPGGLHSQTGARH